MRRTIRLSYPCVGKERRELVDELGAERGGAAHEHPDGADVVLLHRRVFAEQDNHWGDEAAITRTSARRNEAVGVYCMWEPPDKTLRRAVQAPIRHG